MSKLLANQIANYNDNGPVEAKEGINIPTGKPFQVAGAAGTTGQYLKSTGSTVAWESFPTIPAAQVSTDWNATTGVAQILNKPTLATVATSGSYTDLSNQPTIPSAQIRADWSQTDNTSLDYILNKPTLFDGAYSSLTGAPVVPTTFNDLADVNIPSPVDSQYIKWDNATSRWVQGTGSAGLTGIVEDTTPQLGGTLDANGNTIDMGANIITDAKVGEWSAAYNWGNHAAQGYLTTYLNTTYSQAAIADAVGVKIRLSASTGTQDDILLTAGTGITFTTIGTEGFTINSAGGGGGGAQVTVDDSAPSTPTSGDLWWKSNEGRLKVFYNDGSGSQWVDANPPLSPAFAPKISDNTAILEADGHLKLTGHIIPTVNAAYDLGNAEFKIRHLFLSDNSLWLGDEHKIDTSSGEIKTKKRKKNVVPASITAAGGDEAGVLSHSSKGSLLSVTLQDWLAYLTYLDASKTAIEDVYPSETAGTYTNDDWDEIVPHRQHGKRPAITVDDDAKPYELFKSKSFLRTNAVADFPVEVVGAAPTEGNVAEFTVYLPQGNTPRTLTALNIDGVAASQLKLTGTPEANVLNTLSFKCIFVGGEWKATVAIG